MNFEPFPTLLSTIILPPCASTSLLHIASPNPVPFDLVVKNGLKSFCKFSSDIPTPVSSTLTIPSFCSVSLYTLAYVCNQQGLFKQ